MVVGKKAAEPEVSVAHERPERSAAKTVGLLGSAPLVMVTIASAELEREAS